MKMVESKSVWRRFNACIVDDTNNVKSGNKYDNNKEIKSKDKDRINEAFTTSC